MEIDKVLNKFKNGEISKKQAKENISLLQLEELHDAARIDTMREDRIGLPEAILGEGKEPEVFTEIMKKMASKKGRSIGTRVSKKQKQHLEKNKENYRTKWYDKARIAVLQTKKQEKNNEKTIQKGKVGVICAGTADLPIAEEARITAKLLGCKTYKAYDVGVAGIHRILPVLKEFNDKNIQVVIVAAGRDGSLPPVVAGMTDKPVIGLPVSTGYGAGGKGEAALLSMLQSCSLLTVVNIDAGFTAGAMAAKITQT
ncbi:nickel pincer cofactor biosynthesis protein LarB [Methanonatronarchaeum sp. AMET6-2]|uniref:nickel pincer cofactor biosynthesis protein LarB n=1 Tax=Methanonatronarchaeum sp. AMET6-2 TaxID=2933293 RepID=UPI001224F615|nr:nickel pincer cofactor biosynthesis protein LarB [Methanonatronarchaeum sp. AMET6-2]RZN60306.1 MAG: nickel pincer cofactor biosynthesis protein LarB [Methanonatronarchaeia archaeon]UOY10553.1 nickel pincer cofactor biosynthesis protein LarB [Methanonatronarchaeum sp. AMET6-2]